MQANPDASFCLFCQVGGDVIHPCKISKNVRCTVPIPRSILWAMVIPYNLVPIYMKNGLYSCSTNAVNYLFNLHSSSLFRADNIIAFTADFLPIAGVLKIIFRPWPDTMTSWAKKFLLLQYLVFWWVKWLEKSELILILMWFSVSECDFIFTKRQNIRFTGKDLADCSKIQGAWPVNMTGLTGQDSILAGHHHLTVAIILSPE